MKMGAWSSTDFLMPMEDSDGDLVYTYMRHKSDGAMLDPCGHLALFKFVNGNAWGFAEGPDGDCAMPRQPHHAPHMAVTWSTR